MFFVDPVVMYTNVRVSSTRWRVLSRNGVEAQSTDPVQHSLGSDEISRNSRVAFLNGILTIVFRTDEGKKAQW